MTLGNAIAYKMPKLHYIFKLNILFERIHAKTHKGKSGGLPYALDQVRLFVCLVVYLPVNNFSVILGPIHLFLGLKHYYGELKCLAQGHNMAPMRYKHPLPLPETELDSLTKRTPCPPTPPSQLFTIIHAKTCCPSTAILLVSYYVKT